MELLKGYDDSSLDRISELPKELLVSILSCLTLKETARTSVISRIWRDLWQFANSNILNFDASAAKYLTLDREKLHEERAMFVERIDRVLNSHQPPTIHELRVCFDLAIQSSRDIKWVEFALTKRVKRLELDLAPCRSRRRRDSEYYTFGSKFCESLGKIKFLTSLCFKYVKVSGPVLESFLAGCPLLETLHVSHSKDVAKLKVCGPSLRLKQLHISYCECIKSIEVYAPNLLSFEYYGKTYAGVHLDLRFVPHLRHVSYGRVYERNKQEDIFQAFPKSLATRLSRLLKLSLRFEEFGIEESALQCSKLPNLRYLVCEVRKFWWPTATSLVRFTSLMESAPLLRKFKVELEVDELRRRRRRGGKEVEEVIEEAERMGMYGKVLHELREVEIVGFAGDEAEAALLIYLIRTAKGLTKIVINPCHPPWDRPDPIHQQQLEEARMFATHLLSEYKPRRATHFFYSNPYTH